jgi:hypothetical protein
MPDEAAAALRTLAILMFRATRSALRFIKAVSSPRRQSCVACSLASPTPHRRGHARGASQVGNRWRRRCVR